MPAKTSVALNPPIDKDQHLFLLTNLSTTRVRYANDAVEAFSGIDATAFYESDCFYKRLIHPEDYNKFITHLKSFNNEGLKRKEKETRIRIKNKEGGWDWFAFTNRLYNKQQEPPLVISIANPVSMDSQENLFLSHFSSEKDYRHLVESMDEAFCVIEMIFDHSNKPVDYFFLETNPAFEEQLNLKNVVGKTMREMIPDHEDHWFEVYGKVALTGEPIRFQYKAEKIDNAWLDLYAFRAEGENSKKVVVLFRNITESKLAEEQLEKTRAELEKKALKRQKELRQSEELLQTVFDTINQGIAVFESIYNDDGEIIDFKFIKVNKVLQNLYLPKEVLGQNYLDVSRYNNETGLFDALKNVMLTDEILDKEVHIAQEGNSIWFRVTAKKQGQLIIASVEDITKAKNEAQELIDTVRFKRELVRTSPETIMIVNLNSFSVRYINKDIFTEKGITKEKVEGMPLNDILPYIHPRDRQKILDMHRALLKSSDDDIIDIEVRLKLNGVSWEWFSVRGKIFHRRDSSWVDEYVLLIRNITKLKNTQKALLKAEKFSIQGEVARTLAHELRNPIASISMATEVVSHKLEKEQKNKLQNYFDILSRSAKILNNLVGNLLNSSNYTPAVLIKEDLAEIVESSILKAADRIYLAGVNLEKKYQGSYPILADKEKLEIAILNIIVNASEATVPDEGKIEIEIETQENEVILRISDNGQGLEKEQIERLFDAFYTNKETGVGVGLNSVKNILEEHDAKIEVKSAPKKGSTFILNFIKAE